jgi:hypothetical protein
MTMRSPGAKRSQGIGDRKITRPLPPTASAHPLPPCCHPARCCPRLGSARWLAPQRTDRMSGWGRAAGTAGAARGEAARGRLLGGYNMVIQRGKHQIGIRSRLDAYPFEVWAHKAFTPCIVSVFLLLQVIERGTFRSTEMSRFIATPGPVPLQSPHLTRSYDVAGSYSGFAAQEVLCTPGLLYYRCSARGGLRPRGLVSHYPLT